MEYRLNLEGFRGVQKERTDHTISPVDILEDLVLLDIRKYIFRISLHFLCINYLEHGSQILAFCPRSPSIYFCRSSNLPNKISTTNVEQPSIPTRLGIELSLEFEHSYSLSGIQWLLAFFKTRVSFVEILYA